MRKIILFIVGLLVITTSCYAARNQVVTKESNTTLRITTTDTSTSAIVVRISELRQEISELNQWKSSLEAEISEIDAKIATILANITEAKRLGVIE